MTDREKKIYHASIIMRGILMVLWIAMMAATVYMIWEHNIKLAVGCMVARIIIQYFVDELKIEDE